MFNILFQAHKILNGLPVGMLTLAEFYIFAFCHWLESILLYYFDSFYFSKLFWIFPGFQIYFPASFNKTVFKIQLMEGKLQFHSISSRNSDQYVLLIAIEASLISYWIWLTSKEGLDHCYLKLNSCTLYISQGIIFRKMAVIHDNFD